MRPVRIRAWPLSLRQSVKKMKFSNGIPSRLLPPVVALLLFFTVSAFYFAPQFQGEVLPQHDVLQYEGMARDIRQTREATGEDPQWTGGMFGGMPAYLINVAYPAQLVKKTVGQVVRVIDTPAAFLFFAMTAMWLMLLAFGVNPWVGMVPALAYGLSTYFLLIIGAGHITKMWALVYAPLMMGGACIALRGNVWIGAALTALFASLEIGANHPQIAYYFLMAMAAFWISEAVRAFRARTLRNFALRTAMLAAAGVVAVGSNFSPLWYTAQHSAQTIRGGSELAATAETLPGGLSFDYATAWSYGRAETFNLLIPDFMGRESGSTFSSDGEVAAALSDYGLGGAAQQLPTYWGTQPYTGGPTYLGATVIFLGVLGLFLARGRNKWWILSVSILMILLSWGHNLTGLTEFAFKYLPGYNKFRTVSMTLVVVQWAVPLLGALALMRLWRNEIPRKQALRAVAWAAGITGGICLLFAVAGGSLFDFGRNESTQLMTEQFRYLFEANGMQQEIAGGLPDEMGLAAGNAMAVERAQMMSADAWRSLLLILLTAGAVLLYLYRKINKGLLLAAAGVLVLIDLVPVDMRFLSADNFVPARTQRVVPTETDRQILQDEELGYRVMNLTVSPFNDATTSYFHRSVGGYHGAKLARYQDLIDRYLSMRDDGVLDMLNTRYLIVPAEGGKTAPVLRKTANGAAWFVDSMVYAADPQQEIDLLGRIDTKTTAVVEGEVRPAAFGQGRIALAEYRPNYQKYTYTADAPATAVFSEIYYDKGWTAYIDGAEAPYFRADYVLRAMQLPAGTHTVEWKFRAPGWSLAEGITLISSLAILLGTVAALVYYIGKQKRRNKRETAQSSSHA